MDDLVWKILFYLFLFIGALLGISSRSRLRDVISELESLKRVVELQSRQLTQLQKNVKQQKNVDQPQDANPQQNNPTDTIPDGLQPSNLKMAPAEMQEQHVEPVVRDHRETSESAAPQKAAGNNEKQNTEPANAFDLEGFIRANGLLWLGAIVLAIGGIFLAKYSIEAGLFPPVARVVLGGVFGVALVVAAEYLARNKARFNIHSPYVCAALASGGVITCFAIILVAFDYYEFISPQVAFALLALVAVSSTYMALRFGPLLACIGIIGAYAVPVLVSTGSNNVMALLLYTSFVSGSAVWVASSVRQTWLWWLSFAGHFVWLALSLMISKSTDFWAILLFALFSIYLYVLVEVLGWKLRVQLHAPLGIKALLMPRKEQLGMIFPVLALAVFVTFEYSSQPLIWSNIFLVALFCYLPIRHSALDSWPYVTLGFALFSFTQFPGQVDFDDHFFPIKGAYLFIQLGVLFSLAYCWFMQRAYPSRLSYLVLMVLAPASLYGLSYALSPDAADPFLYPLWVMELALIAIASSLLASKAKENVQILTYTVLANACITLCFTMLLDASQLTLALALQIASMSYLSWKYKVALPDWLFKAALAVVVARLTFAPWLDAYAGETILGLHWTLVIYPLVLLVIVFAKKYNPSETFRDWLTGAFVHILALFITTETSYALVGEYPDFANLSFAESVLLGINWLVLGMVYLWRATLVTRHPMLYRWFGYGLMGLSLLIHLDISLLHNPFIDQQFIGQHFLANWMVPMWLLPGLLLCACIRLQLLPVKLNKGLLVTAAVFGFFYINGMIRGVFNEGWLLIKPGLTDAELYSYSICWLLISTLLVFIGQRIVAHQVTKVGFGILAMVVLKAFLIDMSNLEGLYRAVSFIGLGLCLVGVGWLFQKMHYSTSAKQQEHSQS